MNLTTTFKVTGLDVSKARQLKETALGISSERLVDVLKSHDWSDTVHAGNRAAATAVSFALLIEAERLEGEYEYQEALRAYSKAIELDPESVTLRCARGSLLMSELGEHEKAMPDLDWVVAKTPRDPEAWSMRGRNKELLYHLDGGLHLLKGALQDFCRALRIDQDDESTRWKVREVHNQIAEAA